MDESPVPAIEVHGLTKRFGGFTAVNNVSFRVNEGEVFGFLGPNGCGKTTTIRMLCGILAPTSGGGRVIGHDLVGESERIKARIGYMSQRFSLYEDLTVEENLKFSGRVYGLFNHRLRERIERVAGLVALEDVLRRRVSGLAGGWKQRVALASALLHEPRLVFLDEPTGGVDPLMRRRFWDLLYGLAAEGVTMLVTTHYMDEVEHCDRVALMSRGRVAAVGSPDELKAALPGLLYSVECQPLMPGFSVLCRMFEVSLHGDALHVVTDGTEGSEEAIRSALRDQGVEVLQIDPVEPSMEDVFLSLADSQGAGARMVS